MNMRGFLIVVIAVACWQAMLASSLSEQYRKVLEETVATAAVEKEASFQSLRLRADSLMTLPASEHNVISTVRVVLDLCSLFYDETSYHKVINYVSYCRPLLEGILPDTGQAQSVYVDILNHYGMAYGSLQLGDLSVSAFEKALRVADKFGLEDKQAVLYNNIGNIYLRKAQYEEADSLFLKAVRINESGKNKKRLYINYNNLSVSAAERHNYNKALEYAFLAMHQLDAETDRSKRMLLQRNIAEIYMKNGEPSLALRNMREVIAYQEEHKELRHLADSYQTMAHIFDNSADSFAVYLHRAENAAKMSSSLMEIPSILLELGEYYSGRRDFVNSSRYFEEYASVKDSILSMEIKMHMQGLSNVYTKEAMQADRIEGLEEDVLKAGRRVKWVSVVSVCALIVAMVVSLRLLAVRRRKYFIKARCKLKEKLLHIQEMEAEKMRCAEALRAKDEAFAQSEKKRTVMALQALRVHEFTDSLSAGIKQLLLKLNVRDTETRKALRDVLYDISRMDNDSALKEFVGSFENINSRFYDSLSVDYPNLTARELRMCALLRLGLSSKEIAGITFREVRSVEAVRNRLRKKFGLEQSENLVDFLKRF